MPVDHNFGTIAGYYIETTGQQLSTSLETEIGIKMEYSLDENDTLNHLKYRIVRKEGITHYYDAQDRLHHDDGPAVITDKGYKAWWKHGRIHRDDGPAIIYGGGDEFWYNNGKLHREDGPAIIRSDGRQEWWNNGKFVRETAR